jgi:hypothetical protein
MLSQLNPAPFSAHSPIGLFSHCAPSSIVPTRFAAPTDDLNGAIYKGRLPVGISRSLNDL